MNEGGNSLLLGMVIGALLVWLFIQNKKNSGKCACSGSSGAGLYVPSGGGRCGSPSGSGTVVNYTAPANPLSATPGGVPA